MCVSALGVYVCTYVSMTVCVVLSVQLLTTKYVSLSPDEIKDVVVDPGSLQNKALGYVFHNIVGWGGKILVFNTKGDQYDSYVVTPNDILLPMKQ